MAFSAALSSEHGQGEEQQQQICHPGVCPLYPTQSNVNHIIITTPRLEDFDVNFIRSRFNDLFLKQIWSPKYLRVSLLSTLMSARPPPLLSPHHLPAKLNLMAGQTIIATRPKFRYLWYEHHRMELILFPYKNFRFMILHSHFWCLWINSNFIPIRLVLGLWLLFLVCCGGWDNPAPPPPLSWAWEEEEEDALL